MSLQEKHDSRSSMSHRRSQSLGNSSSAGAAAAAAASAGGRGAPGLVRRASKVASNYLKDRRASQQLAAGHAVQDSLSGSCPPEISSDNEDGDQVADATAFLKQGSDMLKVTAKKTSKRTVRLTEGGQQLAWQSFSLRAAIKDTITHSSDESHHQKDGRGEQQAGMHWTYVNLEDILELRFGAEAANYREQFRLSKDHQSKWMTIIFNRPSSGSQQEAVHIVHFVILGSQKAADAWRRALSQLLKTKRKMVEDCLASDYADTSQRWQTWVQQCWSAADANKTDFASYDDIVQLCKDIGIAPNSAHLKAAFASADVQRSGSLDMPHFQKFVKALRRRSEIKELVREIAQNPDAKGISLDKFMAFLRDVQHVRFVKVEEKAFAWFAKYATGQAADGTSLLKEDDLANFLRSEDNPASDPKHRAVCQDMSRPLCEYFISASHNTYLLGNQLQGESTAEGYIRALQHGCRCVELDLWNGPDGEPIIYHGHTLTTKLPVREALEAIAKYAFVASQYPLILSLEVHCDPGQQDKLSELLRHYCGPALVTDPLQGIEPGSFPSPEALRNRFLVKAKNRMIKAHAHDAAGQPDPFIEDGVTSASEMSSSSHVAESSENEIGKRLTHILSRSDGSASRSSTQSDAVAPPKPPKNDKSPSKKKPPMSLELAALLVYTIGVKSRGINKKEQYHPYHMLSLNEKALDQMIKKGAADLLDHNRDHLIRVYPHGFRVNSSNFLPVDAWALGTQLVALNWQTKDLGVQLNEAMFSLNGHSGYVLKPTWLRRKDDFAKDKEMLSSPSTYELDVVIISAQHLTRARRHQDGSGSEALVGNPISPFAEVKIFAPFVDEDKAPGKRTAVTSGNAFNPIFTDNRATLRFQTVCDMLDVVFIRFSIYESGHDDEALGRYCIPVSALLPGYRHLPLRDSLGNEFLFSTLFVKSSIRRV